jgi:hypothetical protein
MCFGASVDVGRTSVCCLNPAGSHGFLVYLSATIRGCKAPEAHYCVLTDPGHMLVGAIGSSLSDFGSKLMTICRKYLRAKIG